MVTPQAPWAAQGSPVSDHLFSGEILPVVQPEPPLAEFEAMYPFLGEEADSHLTTTSFQIVVKSNEVSAELPFFQTKQPKLPQLPLIRVRPFPSFLALLWTCKLPRTCTCKIDAGFPASFPC